MIHQGGSPLDGPSRAVVLHHGAIPYELTHPGEHCGLATAAGELHSRSFVACGPGSRILGGAPEAQPATWATVVTSMFVNGSFPALLGAMIFLVLFGPSVEDAIGRRRFLALYLLGALLALAVQVAMNPDSTVPALTAPGAIAAVLGGYALLHPRAKVITLVLIPLFATIVELPALALLGLWLPMQLTLDESALANPIHGAELTAFVSHLGGLLFGLATIRMFLRRRRAPGSPGAGPWAASPA